MESRVKAQFAGVCTDCGGRIHVGDDILWAPESGARHETCPDTPSIELRPNEEVCTECWLVKPCDC